MKVIQTSQVVSVPENVEVNIKGRSVTVKGPRGTLTRDFRHLALDIFKTDEGIKVELWFGDRARRASVRTVCSHIRNMITGVTKGYRYKMRFVYAHFPVNCAINADKTNIEIRNFLGEKVVRRVQMLPGVTINQSTAVKDEIILEGNDIEKVAQSAANIHMISLVKDKDIRKFLDGIYVSEKGPIED